MLAAPSGTAVEARRHVVDRRPEPFGEGRQPVRGRSRRPRRVATEHRRTSGSGTPSKVMLHRLVRERVRALEVRVVAAPHDVVDPDAVAPGAVLAVQEAGGDRSSSCSQYSLGHALEQLRLDEPQLADVAVARSGT